MKVNNLFSKNLEVNMVSIDIQETKSLASKVANERASTDTTMPMPTSAFVTPITVCAYYVCSR